MERIRTNQSDTSDSYSEKEAPNVFAWDSLTRLKIGSTDSSIYADADSVPDSLLTTGGESYTENLLHSSATISSAYKSLPQSERPNRSNDAFSEYYDLSSEEIEQLGLDTRLRIYDAWCRNRMPNVTIAIMDTWTDDFREQYWNSPYAETRLNEERQSKINDTRSGHPEVYEKPDEGKLNTQSNELLAHIPDMTYQELFKAYEGNREQGILDACQVVAESLSLSEIPQVVFRESDKKDLCGAQQDSTITIYSYPGEISTFADDMDTIAHECFHVYQHQHADMPQTEHDRLYKLNFDAYIDSRMDYDDYRNQLVEAEAFNFGGWFSAKCAVRSEQPERQKPKLQQFAQKILNLLEKR